MKPEDRLPIDYKGFLLRKTSGSLIINSSDYQHAADLMKKNNIKSLEINANFFKGTEINFLSLFDFLEGLSIISSSIVSINPLQYLRNLKRLHIEHELGGEIDFRNFKNLEDCSFMWGISGSETIFQMNLLQKLRIDNYAGEDLEKFFGLTRLKHLSLYHSSMRSLTGLDSLREIEELDLTGCSYLKDISAIKEAKFLGELRLDRCKSLSNLEPLSNLKHLNSLSFNDIGKITSIKSLESLTGLKEVFFTGDTNIEDGNLNYLQTLHQKNKLKKIIFRPRKHYSHSPQDLGFKVPNVVANIFKRR